MRSPRPPATASIEIGLLDSSKKRSEIKALTFREVSRWLKNENARLPLLLEKLMANVNEKMTYPKSHGSGAPHCCDFTGSGYE